MSKMRCVHCKRALWAQRQAVSGTGFSLQAHTDHLLGRQGLSRSPELNWVFWKGPGLSHSCSTWSGGNGKPGRHTQDTCSLQGLESSGIIYKSFRIPVAFRILRDNIRCLVLVSL